MLGNIYMLGMKGKVPVKEAEKELRNQRTSMTARQLRGAMSPGQMGLHFGPQFLAMWIDILLPTLPLSPPVWKVERQVVRECSMEEYIVAQDWQALIPTRREVGEGMTL